MLMNDDLFFIKICRFMGDSKRAVKIRPGLKDPFARLTYIMRQLVFSPYFNNFMLSARNIMNQIAI